FDASGRAASTVLRRGSTPLNVQLQLDLASGDQIRGSVSDGQWTAKLQADRLIFGKTQSPASLAGNYHLIIPADLQNSFSPGGDGYGTVKVDAGGNVLFTGTLADGTKVSQSSALSRQGFWPL